jgi:uncharacterized protein YggE
MNMEPLQKKIFGWSVVFLTVVGAVFLLVLTDRTVNSATTTNTVAFSGRGSVVAKPDIAIVNITILTEANTSKAAQDDNSRKSQDVIGYLEDQDIEEKDIKTSSYNLNPRYAYPRGGTPVITGFQVRQSITVKIRDLDRVGSVLEGVVAAGANQVSGVNLTIDDPDALQQEARAKAIADAKEKAANLEKQLGISLGRIINFSEGGDFGMPVFRAFAEDTIGVGGAGPVPDIPIGENEIVSNVTLTWQIK